MLDEIDAAEMYCKAMAAEFESMEAKRAYKDLVMQEVAHFDKLAALYRHMDAESASKAKKLKSKITES